MRVALVQLATEVGDLAGNTRAIRAGIEAAHAARAEVAVLPELAICGYPPLDLLLERGFVAENLRLLREEIAPSVHGMVAVVGFVDHDPGELSPEGTPVLRNAAAVVADGRIVGVTHKTLLPEYDVFFERRYFAAGRSRTVHRTGAGPLGVLICEDLWDEAYDCKVARELARGGARALLSISASPFWAGKAGVRMEVARRRAGETGLPVVYVNQVGSEDGYEGQLVFDGGSFALGADGRLLAAARRFESDLLVVDLEGPGVAAPPVEDAADETARAIVLGIREYARRCGFASAVLGLSGGIDSAVVAALAVEAMGRERVLALSLPARHSSERGQRDARILAGNLGCELRTISIEPLLRATEAALGSTLAGPAGELAHENVQARLRGLVLMAVSNREGRLLLTTGNKTELALGYCTLYGDMNGGLAPISDVGKLQVYELGRRINRAAGRELIPASIFAAPPSPELRADHVEPFDYAVVGPLVDEIIVHRRSRAELLELGYPAGVVDDCLARVARAEYKRRQAPPGIKVTGKAFGVGRRIPIAHPFRPE
ncbi:MAG: NAD+ synthase [Planctomycetota bacterium]|nr:MAG: NAD+ synthase [Planctomycetota bacterium]